MAKRILAEFLVLQTKSKPSGFPMVERDLIIRILDRSFESGLIYTVHVGCALAPGVGVLLKDVTLLPVMKVERNPFPPLDPIMHGENVELHASSEQAYQRLWKPDDNVTVYVIRPGEEYEQIAQASPPQPDEGEGGGDGEEPAPPAPDCAEIVALFDQTKVAAESVDVSALDEDQKDALYEAASLAMGALTDLIERIVLER